MTHVHYSCVLQRYFKSATGLTELIKFGNVPGLFDAVEALIYSTADDGMESIDQKRAKGLDLAG